MDVWHDYDCDYGPQHALYHASLRQNIDWLQGPITLKTKNVCILAIANDMRQHTSQLTRPWGFLPSVRPIIERRPGLGALYICAVCMFIRRHGTVGERELLAMRREGGAGMRARETRCIYRAGGGGGSRWC